MLELLKSLAFAALPAAAALWVVGHETGVRAPGPAELERLSQRSPGRIRLQQVLVLKAAEAGELERAVAVADRLATEVPDDPETAVAQGLALAAAGEAGQARAAFRRAAALDRTSVRPYLNLGRLALVNDEYQRAVNDYDLATAVRADSLDAWLGLGAALSRLGFVAQAKDAYDRVIGLAPRSPRGYLALGELYADQARPHDAVAPLQRARVLGDRSPHLFALLCLAHADRHQDDTDLRLALEYGERARAGGDNSTQLLFGLGLANQRSGRYREAIAAFQELLKQRSAAHGAWVGISQCYRALGQRDRAAEAALTAQNIIKERQRIEHLQYQIRQYPHRLELRVMLADYLMKTGNHFAAADHYSYVARQRPDEPQRWLKVAAALRAAGAADQAAEMEARARRQVSP